MSDLKFELTFKLNQDNKLFGRRILIYFMPILST
jgi:hypothetical protein